MSLKPVHIHLTARSVARKATVWTDADPSAFTTRLALENTRFLCQFRVSMDRGEVTLHADLGESRWPLDWFFDRCIGEMNLLAYAGLRGARLAERRIALVSLPFPDRAAGFDEVTLYGHHPSLAPVMLVEVPLDPERSQRFLAVVEEAGCASVRLDRAGIPTGETTEPWLVACVRHGVDLSALAERCRLGFARQELIGEFHAMTGDDTPDTTDAREPEMETWSGLLERRFREAQEKPPARVEEFLSRSIMSMLEAAFADGVRAEFAALPVQADPQRKLMHEERAEAMARYSKVDRVCRLDRLKHVFPKAIAAAQANGRGVGRGGRTDYAPIFPFERCIEWRPVPRQYARLLLGICRMVLRAQARGEQVKPTMMTGGLTWFDRTGRKTMSYLLKPSAVAGLLDAGLLVTGDDGMPEPSLGLLKAAEAELIWQAGNCQDAEEEPEI
ncbi:hypothetical protein LAZ40_05525 [Cereibacter sphaeroides]|uniref:hypothetical protein n=1 Tax=Cereibacter sphaeroides TaxID=1063 RepID=UPI001F2E325B|nr:hypothetical protein [Cereibacter sphaeroides]MCE6958509.1 hypothetical protein [Cereibacter sphaeroides]MCE6972829.1 hypothetical protein [Cereibacter sphaeroides]